MATPMQPNSSSVDYVSPIAQALARRKNPRKYALKHPRFEEEEKKTKQKNKKSKKLGFKRIWNEEDELAVLKGLVDYLVQTGLQPNADCDSFYRSIGDSIVSKFSKEQVLSKIRKLKKRFLVQMEKINQGKDPQFTRFEAYELSSMIWGQIDSQFAVNKQNDNDQIPWTLKRLNSSPRKSEPSKKKKKLDTPGIWTDDDEISLLKGLIDFRLKTSNDTKFDWNAFFNFMKGSIPPNVSKKLMFTKIKELKRFYQVNVVDRINKRLNPLFTRDTDSQIFEYSSMIWDQNEAEVVNTSFENSLQTENCMNQEETCKDNEQVVNDEENIESQCGVNAVDKQTENIEEETFRVDEITENETTGKESQENDELCIVKDTFESLITKGFSSYQKKKQFEKLMKIGKRKRKEFSNEWKEICDEEAKLNMKTFRLSTKLVEALSEG